MDEIARQTDAILDGETIVQETRLFDAASGKKLSEQDLDGPPVFDGLIAANGELYMTTANGSVVCYRGQ